MNRLLRSFSFWCHLFKDWIILEESCKTVCIVGRNNTAIPMNQKWFRCVIYHAYQNMWLTMEPCCLSHLLFVFLNLIQLRATHVEVSL